MWDSFHEKLSVVDPEVWEVVCGDLARQNDGINLIASESYPSRAVLQAAGSILTNKYAEGYSRKRYYGGCEFVDRCEDLAVERAKKLFGADHVNVQPHSGSQANMAVYMAMLDPGDTILGMDLSHGGHLTHGFKVSFSGKIYRGEKYFVSRETGQLDYSEVAAVAKETHPKLIVCGYSAYPRTIDFKAFREIADDVGAYLMADIAHIAGLVAAGVHPSPVEYADFITTTTHKTLCGPRGAIVMCRGEYAQAIDKSVFPGIQGGPFMHLIAARAVAFREAMKPEWKRMQENIVANSKTLASKMLELGFDLVSGGTDNHLMLADLRSKNLTGTVAEAALGEAGITLNKNTIPYDPEKPFVTSGVRIGTPCVTIRGMGGSEMDLIAGWINDVLNSPEDASVKKRVLDEVKVLCGKYPVYPKDEC